MVLRTAWIALGVRRVVLANQPLDDRLSGSCPPIQTAVVSGDTVASAAVRRRLRRSISKTKLTSASKTLNDQFKLVHRH